MNKLLFSFTCFLSTCVLSTVKCQIALAFNGTTNVVSTATVPVLNNQSRTIDAWIKTTNTANVQMVIADWGAVSPLGSRFTLNVLNNKLRIEVGGTGITGTTNVTSGQWVHVTAVYESTITTGSNVFLYVNGALDAQGNFTGYSTLTTTNTTAFRLGMRVDGVSAFLGAIDEVKVYNYGRTTAQVAADTVEVCVPQSGLVAYYRLNEGVPNATNTGSITATDYSGAGNNGTLTSFTLSGTSSNWVTGRVRSGAPAINSSAGTNICTGGSSSLSINTANSFSWSNGNSSSTIIAVSPSVTTSYSVVTTNSSGCFYASFYTVTVTNAAPVLTVNTGINPLCFGASTSLTATGAVNYSWSGGITNGQIFTPSLTTQYTLTGGNACGTVTALQTITVVPVPVNVSASSSTICTGSTSTLSAQSAMTAYTWTPGSANGQNIIVSPVATTIYTVTAGNGTCIGTATLQIITIVSPTVTVNSTLSTICQGESVNLVATGAGTGGTYTWMPGGTAGASVIASPASNIAYSVTATNSLGCTSAAMSPIVVIAAPALTASASSALVCNGQTVTLNAGGAGTYTWSTAAIGANIVVTPLAGLNLYTVMATAANNSCTATQVVPVSVITPSVVYTTSVAMCAGQSATLNASGANTYSWNNVPAANGQQVVNPLTNMVYTLTAKTQSLNVACLSTHLSTVVVNANPTITASATQTNICKGAGSSLNASGAAGYTWMPGFTFSAQVIVTPSATTIYTVTGMSNEGCFSLSQLQVNVKTCTGIENYSSPISFEMFPNPATDKLFVRSETALNMQLLDVCGKLIMEFSVGSDDTMIDVSALQKGLYFVTCTENMMIKKVVIE